MTLLKKYDSNLFYQSRKGNDMIKRKITIIRTNETYIVKDGFGRFICTDTNDIDKILVKVKESLTKKLPTFEDVKGILK